MHGSAVRAASKYQQMHVTSRSPLELVAMLYDGLIQFLTQAREGFERGDLHLRRRGLTRALGVLHELQRTLNMDAGGEVARSLDGLYTYLSGRVLEANLNGDAAAIDEALRLATPLRDAWAQVAAAPAPRAEPAP